LKINIKEEKQMILLNTWLDKGIVKFNRSCTTAIIITIIAMITIPGCFKTKKEDASSAEPVNEIVIPVKAALVKSGAIGEYLSFTGTIDAVKRGSIAPAVPAKIEKILVSEGMVVKEGQPLVQMDSRQLQQTKIKYESVKADFDRMKTLRERGSVTPQQFEQIQSGYETAQTSYDQMEENTYLNAPFSGIVIGKYYNEGDVFNSMRTGPDGVAAILTIAKMDEMKIDINVPEEDYVKIKVGQKSKIVVKALNDTSFDGTVTMVTPALDMMSRTSKISITIRNPSLMLKPGMFATVKIIKAYRENVLTVPSVAIIDLGDRTVVFEVPPGTPPYRTQATMKEVKVGLHNQEMSEILDGVNEGAIVVFENNSALDAKTKINVTAIVK
jgi:RND family efflux transporter MFP subunit